MLDFGIARKFTEGETKVVNRHWKLALRLPRIKVHFLGTLRFASRACHKQIEQGRKDDLECWLYMCFDLFDDDKGLPWKRCERDEILTMKQRFFKLETAIAKEARVDFNKPLDWIGITSKKRDKQKSGSEETSTDNKQEETGSGEKEEESKERSRFLGEKQKMCAGES
ncbi:hypothetical protein TELCIR_03838 [Teladorsagia circumcincta]|uniref:Protein kinase domain-containing protein n=1 Tax=Teladorsagia circumcincta TaxID=45464 RepID=A0A2G9UV77_TELCI|nr:hypothetical protein TELCIR_03838 [Teladorsagia circumcincta]